MSKKSNPKVTQSSKPAAKPVSQPLQQSTGSNWFSTENLFKVMLFALVWIAFYPALANGFVDWDDPTYVTENILVLQPTAEHFNQLLHTVISLNYHPLTMISLWMNSAISGAESATPFIATNIFIHALNTILVFVFIHRLTQGKLWAALFTALVFGLHPMHVESVAWVSERKDVLYTFFFLLSLLSYLKYTRGGSKLQLGLALVWFLLSCLSKAMAVSLVPVLILVDYWEKRNLFSVSTIVEKIPFVLIGFFFGYIALVIQGGDDLGGMLTLTERNDAIAAADIFTPWQRLQFASYGYMMYIVKFFFPFGLSNFYPYPSVPEASHWLYVIAPFVFIGSLIKAVALFRWMRAATFGIGFYFFTVLLVLQFISVGAVIMADRYTYLPYIGLAFFWGMALEYLIERKQQYVAYSIVGIFSLYMMVLTMQRIPVWKDHITLFSNALETYPNCGDALRIRGHHYGKTGRIDEAMKDFEKALSINYQHMSVYEGLGNAYGSKGNTQKAYEMFNKAIEMAPENGSVHFNRGIALLNMGKNKEAIDDFKFAEGKMPQGKQNIMYAPMGLAYLNLQNFTEAIKALDKAISTGAREHTNYYYRGYCKEMTGDFTGARADYQECIKLKPDFIDAQTRLNGLGIG